MLYKLKEGLRLAEKISITKIRNLFVLYISYLFSRSLGKVYQFGKPFAIAIEPTTICNLQCPECPSGIRSFTRSTGNLSYSDFTKIIDSVYQELCYLTLYFQGEPYMNKDLLRMISYANSKKIFTVTSTNAHFLNENKAKSTIESGLDKLIISIDGYDQETYEKYRIGGNLEKVINGIKKLVRWRKLLGKSNPIIIMQFLVFKSNQHQIDDMKKFAIQLEVDQIKFKTAQIYDYINKGELIPDNPRYSRYQIRPGGNYLINNSLVNHCWRMWSSSVITWDGRIVPCCFDKDANYQIGNLKVSSFHKIWFSQEYKNFRGKVLLSRREIDICSNCTEGTKIWAR